MNERLANSSIRFFSMCISMSICETKSSFHNFTIVDVINAKFVSSRYTHTFYTQLFYKIIFRED